MPRVKCPAASCIHWDAGFCSAEEIELDPEELSCLTFEELADIDLEEDELEELTAEEGWEEEENTYSLEDLKEREDDEW